MKRSERMIWISVVAFLMVLSLFSIFINEACAGTISAKMPYLKKFVKVLNIIERDYVKDGVDQEKLINGAIKGMLESLEDPHTAYLPDKFMKEMNTTSDGKYGGVGMIISEKDDYIIVVTPIEGGPSFKKGIRAGDMILSVDGESLKGVNVSEAADMLRGTPGTKVTVEILHKDVKLSIDIVRAIIDLPSVKYDYIDNKYGYLRIIQFAGTTDKYVKEALEEFNKKKVKAIIVDLRYNPGGLLGQVIDIVDYFQDEDVIVSTLGRSAFDNTVSKATSHTTIVDKDIPVIVLIDNGSASASEIFAGAIKDTKRGILIGEKSFGKGSVQTIYRLDNDGVKLTVAEYYTPSGISINGIGIEPHLIVKEPEFSEEEKKDLAKLYEDKILDKLMNENSDPSDKQINEFVKRLKDQGYSLSDRFLKKLIKNAAEIDDDKKAVYDIEFDLQLQKALEVLEKGIILHDKTGFFIKDLDKNDNT